MSKGVPLALSHNVNCNRVLHQNVLLLAVATTEAPTVPAEHRVEVAPLSDGLTRVELRFGFMEQPNVPEALAEAMARNKIPTFDLSKAIYYTGHETIIPSGRRPGLPRWREAIFAFMHHNAQRPGGNDIFPKILKFRNCGGAAVARRKTSSLMRLYNATLARFNGRLRS
jgi:KUP system potassium uptake protein